MVKKPTAGPPPIPARSVESEGEKIKSSPLKFSLPGCKGIESPKIVVVAVEGWGKSSLVSHIPGVGILMPESETGYLTLVKAKRVPEVPCLVTKSWTQTLAAVEQARDLGVIALDELSGFEKQCHDHVCRNSFNGDWDKFWHYHKGPRIAAPEWVKFLSKLEQTGKMIVALSHCSIETFKDPVNEDHDRYVSALCRDNWAITRRWADACLFGTFVSVVDKEGKGIGGTDRILYTEHRDTHDAKNRFGMAETITIEPEPNLIWSTIWDAIQNPSKPVTVDEQK